MKSWPKSGPLLLAIPMMLLAYTCIAQTQTNIQQSAATSCAVMSGQRKADGHALQLLLLMDEDISEANPVAIALHREVLQQCPKAYQDYEQWKRVNNPFPAGYLVKDTPTQLLASPDYPIRCRGARGMASTDGKNLIVNFRKRDRPADQLLPGQCSWVDRGLRVNERTRIADERSTVAEARVTAEHIKAGDTWTFWVINDGNSFKATASAKGTPTQKP
jgi:hypothetical protein